MRTEAVDFRRSPRVLSVHCAGVPAMREVYLADARRIARWPATYALCKAGSDER